MLKTCTNCKKEFDLNKYNFYPKKTKQINTKGETNVYMSWRAKCRICFINDVKKRKNTNKKK